MICLACVSPAAVSAIDVSLVVTFDQFLDPLVGFGARTQGSFLGYQKFKLDWNQ